MKNVWHFANASGCLVALHDEEELRTFFLDQCPGIHFSNVRHHLGFIQGNGYSAHVKRWQWLHKTQWLYNATTRVYWPVIPDVASFFEHALPLIINQIDFSQKVLG